MTDVQRGIQALAAFLLGDASLWTTLVTANQLTPPYLTVNPAIIYGPALSTISLSAQLPAGSTSLALSNLPQGISLLYFATSSASGLIAEAVKIKSYDGQTAQFVTATVNAYPQGASVQAFSIYAIGSVNVLLPGDTLFVPVQATGALTLNALGEIVDAFGSDLALPITIASGSIATVSGVDTMIQRFRAAIQTEVSSLPLHPTFGSRLPHAIGSKTDSVKWTALTREALLKLPEVSDVYDVTANATGTTLNVTAQVKTHTSSAAIQLYNESFTIANG